MKYEEPRIEIVNVEEYCVITLSGVTSGDANGEVDLTSLDIP